MANGVFITKIIEESLIKNRIIGIIFLNAPLDNKFVVDCLFCSLFTLFTLIGVSILI